MEFEASELTQSVLTPSEDVSQSYELRNHLVWSPLMESALLEELLQQDRNGKRSDQGWKREVWEAVRTRVQ